MSLIIKDGTGTGKVAQVTADNELSTRAVVETEEHDANEKGNAYNINTGVINLTSGSESAVMYVKNTDPDNQIVIAALAIGLGPSTGGSSTTIPKITVVRNPTGGTIIDNATAVDINSNRNYGSSKTLSVNAYKGAEGYTLTGGDDHLLFFQTSNGRLYATIDEVIPDGSSIGIKIDPQDSNTNMDVYAALICFTHEPHA